MKVLHLVGQGEDIGGVLSVIRNLQQVTADRNWSHLVWVHQKYVESRRPALTYRFGRHACGDSPHHALILFEAFRGFFELKRLLSREPIDVLHAHTRGMLLVAVMTARWLGRRVAFTNHNFARRVGLYRWAARQERMHTILLTPNMARHYGLPEDPPRVSIVSECCADEFFTAPLEVKEVRPKPDGRLRLIGVGNIVRWKNWHLLLAAFLRLQPEDRERIEFVHWGPTPNDRFSARYREELQRVVASNQLEQRFVFRGPTNSIRECLHQADCFVLPSTNEPCSVSIIEALASGLPALVSASGGNVDIVRDGKSGLLFEPDNPADLAAKLRFVLTSRADFLPPAQIRETVRGRSASAVAIEYEKVYRSLCRNGQSGPPQE